MMMRILTFLLFGLVLFFVMKGQEEASLSSFSEKEPRADRWVDSIYQEMSEDERLGQLFMLRAHTDKGKAYEDRVGDLIARYQVGGVCFFQGTPRRQVEVTNYYQSLVKRLPLMVSTDAEWGIGMRLKKNAVSFPYQLTLGAIRDNRLLYDMGAEIAWQLRRMGVHINLAPVADVNNNPDNPVINFRSFGEDRYNVTVKSYMYAMGLQDHGVLACGKHFPGHGDTDVDSHLDLPVIRHDRQRLDSVELYPFRALAQHGMGSFMVAHLNVPALDDRPNRPTTLSRATVTDLLRGELGFDGLIFTDALDMKGVTRYFDSGEVEAEALLAGNDVLVLPEDLESAIAAIRRYLEEGRLDPAQVERSVKRILRTKYELGLAAFTTIPAEGVEADINRPRALALKQKLYEKALTLVRNRDGMLPFGPVDSLRLAAVSIGAGGESPFQKRLADYAELATWQLGKNISSEQRLELIRELKNYDCVIVSLHGFNLYPPYGVSEATQRFVRDLSDFTRVVLVDFGNPYTLRHFDAVDWVLQAYEEDPMMQDLAAQALFGAIAVDGRLPVTVSPRARYNQGETTRRNFRLGYALPERMGMRSEELQKISEIAYHAIDSGATPGCVVLVARDGRIVYEEAFGHHTYQQKRAVERTDLYDLASLTKVTAATLAVMQLAEEGQVDLDQPLARYLPELGGTNKADLTIREIMTHQAGLRDWIPFYKQTLSGSRHRPRPSSRFYQSRAGGAFNVPVTDKLFLREDFLDSIWQQILTSELRPSRDYHYSDLGFYLLADLVERLTGRPLDDYVAEHFYRPMGLDRITYRPREHFSTEEIVPTEEDRYWRRQRIQGDVHDMGAAMLGGVSGHAGLFATAYDVAGLMQMLLWEGRYGGQQLLAPATVRAFTRRYPEAGRRATGFDKPNLTPGAAPNLSPLASPDTYGHLGFTGTAAWADPQHGLVYIFLSNRTYPSMHNYKLNRMDIRPRIQSVAYRAMEGEGRKEEVVEGWSDRGLE